MRRVSVIGAPGTGKTTFAARVAEITGAPNVELDAFWWGPEWTAVDIGGFQNRVRDAVAGESWVIEGFYLDEAARPLVWPRADSIVWLDLPRRTAVVRALRRSAVRVLRRTRLWGGTNRQTARTLSPRAMAAFVRRWPTYPSRIQDALQAEALTHKTIVVRLRDDRSKELWLAELAAHYRDMAEPASPQERKGDGPRPSRHGGLTSGFGSTSRGDTELHPVVKRHAGRCLTVAQLLFPRRVVGFYLVGSVALGGYRPNQSDIDFVAVLSDHRPGDCRRVRALQFASGVLTAGKWIVRGNLFAPDTCNGVFVEQGQLSWPVSSIRPIAGYSGLGLECGSAFDVNPVQWKVFAERGLALKGPAPGDLSLDPEPHTLRQWNLDNLDSYWRPLAAPCLAGCSPMSRHMPSPAVLSWVVLGPVRLHHTVATGEVATKDEAGVYALATFASEWHPIIREALAAQRGLGISTRLDEDAYRRVGAFAMHVIESAKAL